MSYTLEDQARLADYYKGRLQTFSHMAYKLYINSSDDEEAEELYKVYLFLHKLEYEKKHYKEWIELYNQYRRIDNYEVY